MSLLLFLSLCIRWFIPRRIFRFVVLFFWCGALFMNDMRKLRLFYSVLVLCFRRSLLIIHSGNIMYALGRVLYMQNTSSNCASYVAFFRFRFIFPLLLLFLFISLFVLVENIVYLFLLFAWDLPRFLSMLSTNNL